MSDSVIAVCAPCTSRLRDQRASAAGSVSSEKENRARFAPPRPQFDRLYSTNTTLNCNPINTLAAPFLQGPDSPISDSPSVLTMLPVVLSRTLGRPCSRLRCRLSTLRVVPSTADRQLALPLAFLSVNPLGCATLACLLPLLSRTTLNLCWRCSNGWQDWADRFAQRGYSSLLLDLDASVASAATSSHARLEALEQGKLPV